MPMYGLEVSPRSVTGSRKSQKMVAVVTITTPARLIQLLDRWMSGDSHPFFGCQVYLESLDLELSLPLVFTAPVSRGRLVFSRVLLLLNTNTC